jgi:putative tricarboxylic transport membrane protein
VVIGLLALLILVRSLLQGTPVREAPRRRFREWLAHHRIVLSLFALFGAYALLLPLLGYVITTLAFMVSALALLLGVNGWRKWAINLGVSFTLVPLVFVIFRYGLRVWLP